MGMKPITIITSVYSVPDAFLMKVAKAVKQQNYAGKIRHIMINDNVKRKIRIAGVECVNHEKNKGLVSTLNEGFRMAKTEYVVSLMDDCLPSSKDWLQKLVKPLDDKNVAATTSMVEMPKAFWESFDYLAKALTEKEQRVIVPGLDEKGCAYRCSVLKKVGYLNEKDFKNGGEDTDLTVKLQKSEWKIANTEAKVYHYHYFTFKSRMRKEVQYARLSGLVSRKHFFSLPWNFKGHITARLAIAAFFIYSMITGDFTTLSIALVVAISNMRFPMQFKKLGKDKRIFVVPLVNLLNYALYVANYTYALLLNPSV
jgi:cellulose synthase/poly-beta-1,6-N-acetylglucosamine synthase-like glycosyltransferase